MYEWIFVIYFIIYDVCFLSISKIIVDDNDYIYIVIESYRIEEDSIPPICYGAVKRHFASL